MATVTQLNKITNRITSKITNRIISKTTILLTKVVNLIGFLIRIIIIISLLNNRRIVIIEMIVITKIKYLIIKILSLTYLLVLSPLYLLSKIFNKVLIRRRKITVSL